MPLFYQKEIIHTYRVGQNWTTGLLIHVHNDVGYAGADPGRGLGVLNIGSLDKKDNTGDSGVNTVLNTRVNTGDNT